VDPAREGYTSGSKSMTIEKVIILGGGSAGFMAALALKSRNPGLQVLLIRSQELGIIGVGEGSTAALTDYLHGYLRVDSEQFHRVARPTWKLGLKFLWGCRPSFNYTFGPGFEVKSVPDQAKANGFYCAENAGYPDPYSALMSEDRVFLRQQGRMVPHQAFAYHFENENYVTWLEGAARALGVAILDDTVAEVHRDERGISGLALKSGVTERADLYVDCSGFHSVLLGKALAEPFVSYAGSLLCDRAVIGGWNRELPRDEVIKPYTTCETMDAGWAWQIEHENRINRGYVYCPGFISDEEAEAEFRRKNPAVGATRVVRFVSGRYERSWVDNVVAIGNACGFVEPLEATALGVIAQQSRNLADTLQSSDGRPRPTQIRAFNRQHQWNWDAIRRFLAVHYRFNRRLGTPFWRHAREQVDLAGAEEIVEYYRENGPDGYWGATILDNPHDTFTISGYITMLTGMQVPYRNTWQPDPADVAAFEKRRATYRDLARGAFSVREALAMIRSPRWQWSAPK
jgi:tryptophan halogenase